MIISQSGHPILEHSASIEQILRQTGNKMPSFEPGSFYFTSSWGQGRCLLRCPSGGDLNWNHTFPTHYFYPPPHGFSWSFSLCFLFQGVFPFLQACDVDAVYGIYYTACSPFCDFFLDTMGSRILSFPKEQCSLTLSKAPPPAMDLLLSSPGICAAQTGEAPCWAAWPNVGHPILTVPKHPQANPSPAKVCPLHTYLHPKTIYCWSALLNRQSVSCLTLRSSADWHWTSDGVAYSRTIAKVLYGTFATLLAGGTHVLSALGPLGLAPKNS